MRSGLALAVPSCALAVLGWSCTATGPRSTEVPAANVEAQAPTSAAAESSAEEVAAELANPLAPVTTLALQYRSELGLGPDNDTNQQFRLQPAFFKPFADRSALLVRSILPIRLNSWPTDDSGLGDLQVIPYYVPDTTAANFLGYGAAFGFDTATEDALGSGRMTAGPALLFAATGQPMTWGGLVQHVWSVDGSSRRADVSVTTVQPFVTYLLGGGWAATSTLELRQDWEAPSDSDLAIPIALGGSRVVELGGAYFNVSASYVYYAEKSDFDPDWEIRFGITYVMR